MSQQELERDDREVMNLVNGHSHPEAAAAAEEIADAFSDEEARAAEEKHREQQEKAERLIRRQKQKEVFSTVAFVAFCLLAVVALLLAFYVPGALIWVVNVGVLACGVAAAVKIDKYIRWWL